MAAPVKSAREGLAVHTVRRNPARTQAVLPRRKHVDCATNTARKAGVPKKVAPPRRKLGASDAAAAAAVDAAAVLRQEMAAAGAAESNAAARARELATSLQAAGAASAEAEALKATLVSKGSQVALLEAAVAEQRQQHEAEAAKRAAVAHADHGAAMDALRGKLQAALSDAAKAKALQRQAEWERTRAEEKAAANEYRSHFIIIYLLINIRT